MHWSEVFHQLFEIITMYVRRGRKSKSKEFVTVINLSCSLLSSLFEKLVPESRKKLIKQISTAVKLKTRLRFLLSLCLLQQQLY
jgi:hypothetical protein